MIELSDSGPEVRVELAEYLRLLGYPRDRTLEGRARELADWARAWYASSAPIGASPPCSARSYWPRNACRSVFSATF